MSTATKPPMTPPNWVRRVREEDLNTLELLAAQDKHSVVAPSHVFLKHGEIVGCASIGNIVLALPWFDTRQCHAEDTLYFGNQMENIAAHAGSPLLCVPFVPHSPFQPWIERLGYTKAGLVDLTFKRIN